MLVIVLRAPLLLASFMYVCMYVLLLRNQYVLATDVEVVPTTYIVLVLAQHRSLQCRYGVRALLATYYIVNNAFLRP